MTSLDGSDASFKKGKAVRELDHSIIAVARCAANGRGTSRRSKRRWSIVRRALS
jgi:hypothetical protein